VLVTALLMLGAGCGPAGDPSDGTPPIASDAAATPADGAEAGLAWLPIDPGCTAPEGVSTTPQNVEEAVALVNALKGQQEGPLTLPCFLQSLTRPFPALATKSVFSAQPASGPRNPRFFLFSGGLVMSVVPAGDGRPLLELAAYTTPTRSIKAEIHFPVEASVTTDAPYDRIRYGEKTTCGSCHGSETLVEGVSGASRFVSDVLRPRNLEIVPLEFVRHEAEICPPGVDAERCAILTALFGHGEVTRGAFSPEARTIYND